MSTEEIIYGESVRAIDKQEAALDGLRTRTGTLPSAAALALATSILGGQTLVHQGPLDVLAWVAIVGFVAVSTCCVLILLPWTWRFSVSARVLLDELEVPAVDAPQALHRFLAVTHEANLRRNQAALARLGLFFRLASTALVLEVIAWTIDLSSR